MRGRGTCLRGSLRRRRPSRTPRLRRWRRRRRRGGERWRRGASPGGGAWSRRGGELDRGGTGGGAGKRRSERRRQERGERTLRGGLNTDVPVQEGGSAPPYRWWEEEVEGVAERTELKRPAWFSAAAAEKWQVERWSGSKPRTGGNVKVRVLRGRRRKGWGGGRRWREGGGEEEEGDGGGDVPLPGVRRRREWLDGSGASPAPFRSHFLLDERGTPLHG